MYITAMELSIAKTEKNNIKEMQNAVGCNIWCYVYRYLLYNNTMVFRQLLPRQPKISGPIGRVLIQHIHVIYDLVPLDLRSETKLSHLAPDLIVPFLPAFTPVIHLRFRGPPFTLQNAPDSLGRYLELFRENGGRETIRSHCVKMPDPIERIGRKLLGRVPSAFELLFQRFLLDLPTLWLLLLLVCSRGLSLFEWLCIPPVAGTARRFLAVLRWFIGGC